MAEQHKESSPADSKEKKSSLDDEIGKDFFGTWKSMSMADEVAMDFSFDTVSKSKKKTFDFEKLDINFNLDSEFDKLSSFKLDMPDLDFTCPPKKTPQSNDKKGEVSSTKAGKQDGFNFNFDFDELDSFNLDSSSIKVDTAFNSNPRKKCVAREGSDSEGAKMPNTHDDEGVDASNDRMATEPPASERQETLKVVETLDDSLGNLVSQQEGSASKFSSSGNVDMPIENQTLDTSKCILSTKEIDEERDILERTKSTELKSEQAINMTLSQSVGQSDTEQDMISGQRTEVFLPGTRVIDVSGDKQEVNSNAYEQTKVINVSGDKEVVNGKATYRNSDEVDLGLEKSSPLDITKSDNSVGEANNLGSSIEEGVTDHYQPEKRSVSCDIVNKSDALKKISCDNDSRENRTTSECHLAPASRKPVVDKMMQMKERKYMQSNMFGTTEDKSSSEQPSLTVATKGVYFGSKRNADMHLASISQARETIRSNGSRLGSKSVGDSLAGSGKLTRDAAASLDSKDDLKSSSNTREAIVSDVIPSKGKLTRNMQSRREVNKCKATFQENGMSTKYVALSRSQVDPSCLTEKTGRITAQISVNSQPEASRKESSEKSRINSLEGNKLSSFKASKITPTLSSSKTLRNIGANRVLATSFNQKENSLVISGQSLDMQGSKASKNDHLTHSDDNQKSSTPLLKRKSIEVSEEYFSSFRPLKRLSQSPGKSRNSKKSLEVVGEVHHQSLQMDIIPNSLVNDHSTSELQSPFEMKVIEMEIPDSVLLEDNSNVEKAEAYMKELEDICNMLKKKHDEAKELLVRAIVNDNNLLMLNHPVYEEEIRKVQKFASQLMPEGIQT